MRAVSPTGRSNSLGKSKGCLWIGKRSANRAHLTRSDDEELERAIELLHAEVAEYEQKLLPPLKKEAKRAAKH